MQDSQAQRSASTAVGFRLALCALLAVASLGPAPADISERQARKQIDQATAVLASVGLPVAAPTWRAADGYFVGQTRHSAANWAAASEFSLASGVPPLGQVACDAVVQVFLSTEAAAVLFDGAVTSGGMQSFLTTCEGAAHASVDVFPQAWMRCGNVCVRVRWTKGMPAGQELNREEGLLAIVQLVLRIHEGFREKGACQGKPGAGFP